MSLLNGTVQASERAIFDTYAEASDYIDLIVEQHGINAFEGMQVRDGKYIVNFDKSKSNQRWY